MAVPKKKTSYSKKSMRRSHHAIKLQNISTDLAGEYILSHHMCLTAKTYKGKVIVQKNIKQENK